MLDIEAIKHAARKPAKGLRSPLYHLMWDDYDRLSEILLPNRTNWKEVSARIYEMGGVDGRGRKPSVVTIQKTWAKVVEARGGEKRRRRKRVKTAFVRASCS